jgi:hypothetical protein
MKNKIYEWLLDLLPEEEDDFIEVDFTLTTEELHKAILKEWGSKEPADGCIFITPEGLFINLFPHLHDHEDLCTWVTENDLGDVSDDASWFIKELGYIKCRNTRTLCYAELPSKTTSSQLAALELWLETKVQADQVEHIDIGTLENEYKTYDLNIYFPEDVIKRIKRFYSSGHLYETKIRK